jgi:hypothetical protein
MEAESPTGHPGGDINKNMIAHHSQVAPSVSSFTEDILPITPTCRSPPQPVDSHCELSENCRKTGKGQVETLLAFSTLQPSQNGVGRREGNTMGLLKSFSDSKNKKPQSM